MDDNDLAVLAIGLFIWVLIIIGVVFCDVF